MTAPNIKKTLQNKAAKSGISYSVLHKVYLKGKGAWSSGHYPGVTSEQWAIARVNSFIVGGKARKVDSHLLKKKAKPTKKKK
jgi:hypothetical protein